MTLVSGPGHRRPAGVKLVNVETAHEMLPPAKGAPADVAICAAAVADWRVDDAANQKIKKEAGGLPSLKLARTRTSCTRSRPWPEAPPPVDRLRRRNGKGHRERASQTPTQRRRLDRRQRRLAGDRRHGRRRQQVHLVTASGVENWPLMSKDETAARLLARAGEALLATRLAAE